MRMRMKSIAVGVFLWTAVGASGTEDIGRALMKLEDRFNQAAFEAIGGAVDYELLYTGSTPGAGIVSLEPGPGASLHASSDSVATPGANPGARGAGTGSRFRTEVAYSETTRTKSGATTVRFITRQVPVPAPRAVGLTKADLPADLRQANVTTLKQSLGAPQNAEGGARYIGAMASRTKPRFAGERLTDADQSLSMMQRRVLRWKLRRLLAQRPPGSLLFLELARSAIRGNEASADVGWAFKSPGATPGAPVTHASGELLLTMGRVEGAWRVAHIEQVVDKMLGKIDSLAASGSTR